MVRGDYALAAVVLASVSVVAVIIFILMVQRPPLAPPQPQKYIVVVPITAVLSGCWVNPSLQYITGLNASDVAGIVLYIDSPGGTLDATEALYGALKGLGKPMYAVITGLGASGAFYVAMAAQRVYASPSALVGNIGAWTVINPAVFWTPVPLEIYSTGPEKLYGMTLFSYYNAVDQAALSFLKVVVESRGARLRAPGGLLETGKLFTAEEALKLGLVDKIGGLSEAVSDMARSLGLTRYSVATLYSYYGVAPPNCTSQLASEAKIPLAFLLNASAPPIFYIYPGAVQIDINKNAPNYQVPQGILRSTKYVLIDLSHGNIIPEAFVQALAADLIQFNCSVVFARDSAALARGLQNASGVVIAEPTSPYSADSADALASAANKGTRIAVFYDPRLASSIFITSQPPLPVYLDALLSKFGVIIYDGYLYNATASLSNFSANWQFLRIEESNLTGIEASGLVLFTPAALAGRGAGAYVDAHLTGYGRGIYAVVLQRGNLTLVGSITSFLPYFVRLGNNSAFLRSLAGWLCGPS